MTVGNKVPADLRLLSHSGDIRFDKSMLTGESEEVEGAVDATDPNFLESRNIALMGTMVVNGSGTGVVVLTGHRSVMGRIAQAMGSVKEKPTLIQQEISRFVRIIMCLTVFLALLIALTWTFWLRRDHPDFLSVVGMLNNVMGCVVAFIPEGMPIGVSITLLMIAKRMKATDILPKGLSVVETLGCVNVICSDKTGTLTQNLMSVKPVSFLDRSTSTKEMTGIVDESAREDTPTKAMDRLRKAAALCNDSSFDPTSLHLPVAERLIKGNATDAATLRFAALAGETQVDALLKEQKRSFAIPFNSKNKWMLTMFRKENKLGTTSQSYEVFIKGAPDVLLPACTKYWSGKTDSVQTLDSEARSSLQAVQNQLSNNAERVIMLCEREMIPQSAPSTNAFTDEVTNGVLGDNEFTIIGILGIVDPPRPEAASTVADCRRAGARFFMVTGDFGLTAAAIARNVGIFTHTGEPDSVSDLMASVDTTDMSNTLSPTPRKARGHRFPRNERARSLLVEGHEISRLSSNDWNVVCEYDEVVFARTTPEQKLRIVKELRERDNIVAVTGDGVNDAPALRAADVGVAIVSGSDVAIEASDLVLLDKFDSIVEAIRLGRLVFQNLQKVVSYLLPAGSWSEIWPVLVNVLFGVPLPLSSFLMIIICVFTDLFLSLSLIMEKAEFDLLSIPPRDHKRDHLINLRIYGQAYLFTGSMETSIAHAMYFFYMWKYAGIPIRDLFFLFEGYTEGFHGYTQDQLAHFNSVGQSVYFVTLVILQWGNILAVRNRRLSIVQADPFTAERRNPYLLGGMLISLVIAIFVTEVPGIQSLFGTASIPLQFWFIPLPLALGILIMNEIQKLIIRLFPRSLIAKAAW